MIDAMVWVQVALVAGLQMAPAQATSQAELQLSWEAPAACPSKDVVLERVQGSLGRALGETKGTPVRVVARVKGTPGRLRLLLHTETSEGESDREMSGQTCDVLVEAAALVIAVTLEPALAFGPEPEPEPESTVKAEPLVCPTCPEPAPARPEPVPPEPVPTVVPRDPITTESPLAGAVRAGATGSLGPLPSVAPGIELAVALLREHVRLELGFDYFFARRAPVEGSDGREGEIQLWTVTTRGCGVLSASILEFPLCAGLQAGPMRGEGRGVAAPSSTRLAFIAAEAGGALVVRGLPLVDVWLGADFVVPLTRPGFSIDDVGLVHRSAVVGGEATIGLEVRFGPGRAPKTRSK